METLNKKSQQIFFFCKGNGTTEFKMNPSTLLNKDCCSFTVVIDFFAGNNRGWEEVSF